MVVITHKPIGYMQLLLEVLHRKACNYKYDSGTNFIPTYAHLTMMKAMKNLFHSTVVFFIFPRQVQKKTTLVRHFPHIKGYNSSQSSAGIA